MEGNIEVEKPAEDAATEIIPEATPPNAGEKDIPPPEDQSPVAAAEQEGQEPPPDVPAAEQPSNPPQEETPSAIPTASEPSAEETAAESNETVVQESEADIAPESDALAQPEEEARASEPAPSEPIDGMEPDHQDSGEIVEATNPSGGESAASEVPALVEIVEDGKQEGNTPDSPSRSDQEERVDDSRQPESEAKVLQTNDIIAADAPDLSSEQSHPVDLSGGDISQEDPSSHETTAVDQHPTAEQDASPPDLQSSGLATSAEKANETITTKAPTTSEDIQDAIPADSDDIVQVIDVNNNGSTDDTAAIIVVDVDASDATDMLPSPPPPPPAPHVTIAEPVKPSKPSRKKSSSSKSSKSRPVEKPKERPVKIIPLREGRVNTVAKGKSKNKVKGKSDNISDVESVEMIPPPPPPVMVDVPPPAPSPPPSGHVIEAVGVEEVQVVGETAGEDGGEDAVVMVLDSSSPGPEINAGDAGTVEQPEVDHVSNEKEPGNNATDSDTAIPSGTENETSEVAQTTDNAVAAVPEQHEENQDTSTTADPPCVPDADATETGKTEQSLENEAAEKKEEDAPAVVSPPRELDVKDTSLEQRDHVEVAEDPAEVENEPLPPQEAIALGKQESELPSEDTPVGNSPQDQPPEASATDNAKPDYTETTVSEGERLDRAQSEDTSNDAPVAEPSKALEDMDKSLIEANPPPPATEEANNSEGSSKLDVEEPDAINNLTNDGTVGEHTPEPFVEPGTEEESISEVLEKVSASEASEPDSPKPFSTDPAMNGDTEASTCSDPTAPVDETSPTNSAEVVAEPTPTLMELAALMLPSDTVAQSTEDVAVTKAVPEVEPAEVNASTLIPAAENKGSEVVAEATIEEDSGSKGEVDATDQELPLTEPPDTLVSSELATKKIDIESDDEDKDAEHVAPTETVSEGVDEVQQSEVPAETTVLASVATDDQESDQKDSANHDHVEDTEDGNENKVPVQTEDMDTPDETANSLEKDAEPIKNLQTPEIDDDHTDAQKLDTQDIVAPAEVETESPEAPTATLEGQAHDSIEMKNHEPISEQPGTAEAAEPDTKDSSSSISEEQVEAEVHDAHVPCTVNEAQVTEEKVVASPADDGVTGNIAAPAAKPESDLVKGPASIHEDTIETLGSAEVPEQDTAEENEIEADEVTSQPAVEDLPAEHVAKRPAAEGREDIASNKSAADQVGEASEPCVNEPGDSGTCETSKEQNPTKFPEPVAEEEPSEQSVEAKADRISEQQVDATEDATLSTTGADGANPHQESPLPMLADEAQAADLTEALEQTNQEGPFKPGETTEATQSVDTAPLFETASEPNEESSPGQEPIPILEEQAIEPPQPGDATREPEESPEEPQPPIPEIPDASVQESVTETEVLPEHSLSQQSRCETISDSNSGRRSPLVKEPVSDQPAPEEAAASSPSKHSSKVSFDETPISTKGKVPATPPKERRKSSKSSSSHRHSSSRHKVKDVSRSSSDQNPPSVPTSSRRRNSTTTTPQPGLLRRFSTTTSRSSRAEAAEQAEIRRRAAELAAREQEVQRQLAKARKRAALEEQERRLWEKEEELERLKAVEKEKKRARREEQRRREQEALEQERLARENAEEEARAKELERAERRKRRREFEKLHNRDDRPTTHRHSSNRETGIRDISPTPKPRVRRHRTEDIGPERLRSRGEHDTREAPTSSRSPEGRRHRRSSHRDAETAEKPKKSIWRSFLSKI